LNAAKCKRASGHESDARFAVAVEKGLCEVGGVLVGKAGPLFGQVIGRKDSRNRAGWHAGAAVDALRRIDEQLIVRSKAVFILLRVDAVNGTSVYTGGVLGSNTGFCNYVSHRSISGDLILNFGWMLAQIALS